MIFNNLISIDQFEPKEKINIDFKNMFTTSMPDLEIDEEKPVETNNFLNAACINVNHLL